jgi:hypothetical protein
MSAPTSHDRDRQGARTHEQQQRIINRQENTKAADIEPVNETIEEARQRHPEQPETMYDIETGERAVEHGANQESEHRKRRG